MAEKQDSQVVVDVGKWEWSELLKKEDWWAVWLGFFILLMGVIIYFPHSSDMNAKLAEIEGTYLADAQKTDKFRT
ncbi:MAG: putative sulfate exporter family transporter, partial [Desulfofustis sp.]|nr:putative sulfate exporter family transporter [Desulfofustis sp.]